MLNSRLAPKVSGNEQFPFQEASPTGPNVMTNGVTEQEAIDKLKEILEAQFMRAKFLTIDNAIETV